MVLRGDLLRAQMLLDRDRIVGAALDGGVVGDDRARRAADGTDPGDDARRRRAVVVHAVGGERRELEERRPRIDEPVDPLARGEFAALAVALAGRAAAALVHARQLRAQLRDEGEHRGGIPFGRIHGDDSAGFGKQALLGADVRAVRIRS